MPTTSRSTTDNKINTRIYSAHNSVRYFKIYLQNALICNLLQQLFHVLEITATKTSGRIVSLAIQFWIISASLLLPSEWKGKSRYNAIKKRWYSSFLGEKERGNSNRKFYIIRTFKIKLCMVYIHEFGANLQYLSTYTKRWISSYLLARCKRRQ